MHNNSAASVNCSACSKGGIASFPGLQSPNAVEG